MKAVSNFFSNTPPLFSELARSLAGEIDCSQQTLNDHSKDGGSYHIRPQAIVYPKTVTDIKHVIIFAREYSMPITTCGEQTSGSGGSLGEGIVLDMTRHFNRIRHVNVVEHTVTVDAGVSIRALCEKLHTWNMEIPGLSLGDQSGTVGGLLSTKRASSSTFYHGTIREWVEGLTVVVDTGEEHHIRDGITPSGRLLGIYQSVFPLLTEAGPILRGSKPENADDATGYSIWGTSIGPRQLLDQMIGSEGTLGVITSVTFRVRPEKPYSITLALSIENITLMQSCIECIKHNDGENIFMYDETFAELAHKTAPSLLLGDTHSPFHILVSIKDTDEKRVTSKMAALVRALPIPESACSPSDLKTLLTCQKYSFIEKITHNYTNGAHVALPLAGGIIVSPQAYQPLIEEVTSYLDKQGKVYTISGYAGSGHLSVTVLFDPKSPQYDQDVSTHTQNIYALVKKYKGGLSATGGDGLAKTPFLPLVYNDATMQIFKKIKESWDPLFVFNPSKKLQATTAMLHKYLRKD